MFSMYMRDPRLYRSLLLDVVCPALSLRLTLKHSRLGYQSRKNRKDNHLAIASMIEDTVVTISRLMGLGDSERMLPSSLPYDASLLVSNKV
jgi:hypothetical protein